MSCSEYGRFTSVGLSDSVVTVTFGRIVIVSGRSAGKLGQMSVALSQKLHEPACVGVPSIRQFEESTSLLAEPTSARPGGRVPESIATCFPLHPDSRSILWKYGWPTTPCGGINVSSVKRKPAATSRTAASATIRPT